MAITWYLIWVLIYLSLIINNVDYHIFLVYMHFQFSSIIQLCPTVCDLWITAHQASLSITNARSPPKPMSIESVMPSNHLTLCRPLLLLPPILPSIRVFSNESTLRMKWPKYWSFSFSISPSNEHPGLISFRMDWLDLLVVQGTTCIFSLTRCLCLLFITVSILIILLFS